MKDSVFSLPSWTHALAQGRLQLEPFGLAGVVTLQGIAEALLISNFFQHCS